MKKVHFSIRGILATTVIVGLAIAYYLQFNERARLETRLDRLIPTIHIWIWPDRTNTLVSTGSLVSHGCTVFVPYEETLTDDHAFRVELREAATGEVVASELVQDFINNDESYSLSFTLRQQNNTPWNPGLHVLRVTLLDGEKAITRSSLEMEMVDIRKNRPESNTSGAQISTP
ncbi:MAG TPA: hypothetical protein DDW52_05040 [Planctomycetaceae bacterium]|nr:hypothetical protein [Planctomycetaceae bacterium]